jgi:hypothetical protein
MPALNNQVFVACEARAMKPQLNETGFIITAVRTDFIMWIAMKLFIFMLRCEPAFRVEFFIFSSISGVLPGIFSVGFCLLLPVSCFFPHFFHKRPIS